MNNILYFRSITWQNANSKTMTHCHGEKVSQTIFVLRSMSYHLGVLVLLMVLTYGGDYCSGLIGDDHFIILFYVYIIILNSLHQSWSYFGTFIFNVLDTCNQPANPWFLTLIPREICRNGIRLWERYCGSSTQHTRDESWKKSISINLLNLFHDIYALHNGGIWFNVNMFQ